MRKVYNFSPGPAMLPEAVLQRAQQEMLDWHNTGMSVMELGHRGDLFAEVIHNTEADLRALMDIPSHYAVLFLPGGASLQFSAIPMNLLGDKNTADYVDTGIWSKKAIEEGKRYGDMQVIPGVVLKDGLTAITPFADWQRNTEAAWLHYTPNETIEGIEFQWIPETGGVPLVADMTSCILSQPVDVTRFGMIYAGAQKNLGQAGLTVVIIREDLLNTTAALPPSPLHYYVQAKNHSMYNTPPTYAWYMTGLVLEWMKQEGGLAAFDRASRTKSEKLYSYIDSHSEFYLNRVHPSCRSRMNVPFSLANESLTETFLQESEQAGLTYLRGHRLAGGLRASIYNAMPEAGVDALIAFMKDFGKRYG